MSGILAYVAANWLTDQKQKNRAWRLTNIAHDLVLWVEDGHPEWPGVQKLNKVIELIVMEMDKAGWDDVTKTEAEIAARAAYQEAIGLQKKS